MLLNVHSLNLKNKSSGESSFFAFLCPAEDRELWEYLFHSPSWASCPSGLQPQEELSSSPVVICISCDKDRTFSVG